MAFADDEDKRRSIFKGRRGKRVGPIPDGDISSAADRAHISYLYRDETYAGTVSAASFYSLQEDPTMELVC
jgi:hypothetical protein